MASEKYSKSAYDVYKKIPEDERTQEMNNYIQAFEAQEVGMPSKEDMDWARSIHNERDQNIRKIYENNGQLDEALKIIKREGYANELLRKKGQTPYVRTVRTTPEDVMKAGVFKFNWKDVYENVKGEKLKATEADAKKLNDFINSNMYDINAREDDGSDLSIKKKAYDLHMWNPNTSEPWPKFIQSEQGERFQNYLEDVQKAQKDKRLNEIWDGEDDNKVTSFLTDFMLPVSKEYGKKNYENIHSKKDMIGPLAADIGANFIMTGLGSGLLKKTPRIFSSIYGNVAAPAVTETGNVLFNDQSIPEGLLRTAEGVTINVMTPRAANKTIRSLDGGTGDTKLQREWINEAANKARNVRKKMKARDPYPALHTPVGHLNAENPPQLYTQLGKKDILPSFTKKEGALLPEISRKRGKPTIYSSEPALSTKLSQPGKGQQDYVDVLELPRNQRFITPDERLAYLEGSPLLRGKNPAGGLNSPKNTTQKELTTIKKDVEWLKDPKNVKALKANAAVSRNTYGDNFSGLSDTERRRFEILLNQRKKIPPKYGKETFSNYLIESFKEHAGDVGTNYATNMMGRPYFGRQFGPVRMVNRAFGDDLDIELFKKDPTPEESQLSRILKMLEKEQPYITK